MSYTEPSKQMDHDFDKLALSVIGAALTGIGVVGLLVIYLTEAI